MRPQRRGGVTICAVFLSISMTARAQVVPIDDPQIAAAIPSARPGPVFSIARPGLFTLLPLDHRLVLRVGPLQGMDPLLVGPPLASGVPPATPILLASLPSGAQPEPGRARRPALQIVMPPPPPPPLTAAMPGTVVLETPVDVILSPITPAPPLVYNPLPSQYVSGQ